LELLLMDNTAARNQEMMIFCDEQTGFFKWGRSIRRIKNPEPMHRVGRKIPVGVSRSLGFEMR
jgi:hypothetical protein